MRRVNQMKTRLCRAWKAMTVLLWMLCCWCSIIGLDFCYAQTPTLHIQPQQQEYTLWENLSFMEDTSGAMTMNDVLLQSAQHRFIPASEGTFSSSFRSSVYWGRFTLTDTFHLNRTWILASRNFQAKRVDVFIQHDSSGIPHYHQFTTGNATLIRDKDIPWYGAAAQIPLPDNQATTVYVRIESHYFFFDFTLISLSQFLWSLLREHIIYGLFYGGMLMLIVYNLALFFGLRERIYVLCAIYALVAGIAALTQDGLVYEVFPYILAQSRTLLVHLIFGALVALLALFAAEFLHTESESKPTHQFLLFIATFNILRALISPILPTTFAGVLLNATDNISTLAIAALVLWRWRTLSRTDRVFALATVFFVACFMLYVLTILGVIEENPFLRRYSFHLGIIVQTGLFSLVASMKIGDLKHEKLSAETEAAKAELYRVRNDELALANAEITRQQDLVSEQAREIEIANTRLQEQNVKLEKLNAQKNDFLGMAAHDLKNPLMSIRDLAQALEAGGLSETDTTEFAGMIHNSADRMFALIKDLLDTNALEQGGIKIAPELFDMNILVQNVCTTHSRHATSKAITFDFFQDPPSQAIFCFADPSLSLQVIDNLISNAVKYSPSEKRIFVKVIRQPTRFIRVEIRDEGQGLSDEDKKNLFGRFAKLSARPTAGEHSTGLGLSIAKNLVELMNGRIWCESTLGEGATFFLELPSRAV